MHNYSVMRNAHQHYAASCCETEASQGTSELMLRWLHPDFAESPVNMINFALNYNYTERMGKMNTPPPRVGF